MKKAIILNAGEGKRLRPLTQNMPKCLLEIGDRTILEHQLFSLEKCGIKTVILVLGYKIPMILEKLRQCSFDLKIRYTLNPIYSRTNTAYSLWLVRDEMNQDFLYLNGDVFFHINILKRLLRSRHNTCLAIVRKEVGAEEVKVKLSNGLVTELSKDMAPSMADGEFVGIAKFSRYINDAFINKLNEIVNEGTLTAFFELAIRRLLKTYNVWGVDISDLPCIEIDTHEDLEDAKRIYLKLMNFNNKIAKMTS